MNEGEDLMKTVQLLYNNQTNKYFKTFTIHKYIYNRLYCLDKNIWNKIIVETFFSKFNWMLISIPKSVTESTDEMIIELLIFKSYLFFF